MRPDPATNRTSETLTFVMSPFPTCQAVQSLVEAASNFSFTIRRRAADTAGEGLRQHAGEFAERFSTQTPRYGPRGWSLIGSRTANSVVNSVVAARHQKGTETTVQMRSWVHDYSRVKAAGRDGRQRNGASCPPVNLLRGIASGRVDCVMV
jgi:hypothetical protein